MDDMKDKSPRSMEEIIESFTPEQKKRDTSVGGLKVQNLKMLEELASLGAHFDLSFPRIESLLEWMVEQGVLSIDERLDEQERWERKLRVNLQANLEQIREIRRQQGMDQKRQSGLIVPGAGQAVPR